MTVIESTVDESGRSFTLTKEPAKSNIFLASAQASLIPCIDLVPLISNGPSNACGLVLPWGVSAYSGSGIVAGTGLRGDTFPGTTMCLKGLS